MKGQFSVLVGELRASGGKAESAAGVVGKLDPGSELESAGKGIPGADSITALTQVGSKWESHLTSWRDQMQTFGEHLDVAADDYQRGDDVGAEEFSKLVPGGP
ncbi:type VII secretion target [Kineosporia sp. NBRC 101731]|uniref:type VII secretion target n=1 Tax=Kineosporia sp. NBRC 101731 TaxID=3032199 RepID=UPI0024A2C784|nr:type VII secretion target [Kineosporia sp. NBRC 101731]GLY31568.1 hypothetical protein Kisp02_49330 [Kineosporia sp. NBRC 101731]